jgi:Tfp pilus assembly protein PilP
MMLFVRKGNGWIGSLALAFCLVLLMALPIHAAQGGNQTIQPATDNATAQDTGSAAIAPPAPGTEQKAAAEATATPEKEAEAEKVITAKRQKVLKALTKKEFSYIPENMVDPFISFVVAMSTSSEAPRPREEEEEATGPPKPQMPLTPLQKMAVGQIERGFKAVIWGGMGMRALIEDDAGKGYIVGVGTPLGGNNGIITDIQNDRLVIQQELWDANLKQMIPRSVEVRLTKAGEQK